MKIRIYGVLLLVVWIVALPAWGGEKVAILDFKSILASDELGVAVAEILRTELIGLGDYTVVERGMLEDIIEEQALQLTGVMDATTAVEIGRLAGANLVVTGSIVKTGSVYTINARFIDVETGIAKIGQNIRGEGEDEISNMVHQLALIITGKTVAAEEVIGKATQEPALTLETSGSASDAFRLFSFENQQEREQWDADSEGAGSRLEIVSEHTTDGDHALHLALQPYNDWQGIRTVAIPADWSAHKLLAFDAYYAGRSDDDALPVLVRIDDERTNRLQRDWFTKPYSLKPGPSTVRVYVDDVGKSIDIRHIKQLIVSTNKLQHVADVYLDNFRLENVLPPAPVEPFMLSFETPGEARVNFQANGRLIQIQQAKKHATDGNMAMKLGLPRKLPANDYPGVESITFPRDWSNYHTFRCDVFVEDKLKEDLTLVVRIDDVASTSYENRFHWDGPLRTGENRIAFSLEDVGQILDLTRIVQVHMFLEEPGERTTLYVDSIVLK